jgi:hypothetical protein
MLSREAANTNSIVFDLAIKPLMWLNINGTHDFFRIKEVGYNFFLIWFTAHRYMHCLPHQWFNGQIKDNRIGICCFSTKHAALRSKRLIGSESG